MKTTCEITLSSAKVLHGFLSKAILNAKSGKSSSLNLKEPSYALLTVKGQFTLNAILVRFAVVRSFMRFLTSAVDENIFHTIQTQTVLLPTGCFAKPLTIVF